MPNVIKMWQPKLPVTLWATPGLLRDTFTFTIMKSNKTDRVKPKYWEKFRVRTSLHKTLMDYPGIEPMHSR